MTTAIASKPTFLTNNDQCDQCPAVARFRYQSEETGNVLDLCGHHSDEHGPRLDEMEFRIVAWRGADG